MSIIEWLLNHAGPIIRYRTAMELVDRPIPKAGHIQNLLNEQMVRSLLAKLDGFGPITAIDNRTMNAIHGGDSLEECLEKLLEYGLTKDIKPFHERMVVFRQYVNNKWVKAARESQGRHDVQRDWALFFANLLSCYLIRAGYRCLDVLEFVKFRTEELYRNAKEMNFDIYYKQSDLAGMPKRPPNWLNTPVVRAEFFDRKSLPNIWDIFTLAYLLEDYKSKELREQTDKIVEYIFDDRFQALPPGYGLVFSEANRRYYALGWSPHLPGMHGFENPIDQRAVVRYTDLMSHFDEVRKTIWFKRCLKHLETFKRETGTYCFPKSYLPGGLGENRRRKNALEIESTFRMLLIKRRITE